MTITLWTIFEILINFYQGGLETWFIYKFLTPRSHERAKIWAVIFAVCEGCLVTVFNYFTVFEGFGSALYWASLLVVAFRDKNLQLIPKSLTYCCYSSKIQIRVRQKRGGSLWILLYRVYLIF